MKQVHLISISVCFFFIILLTTSCKKDSPISSPPACTTCNHPTLSTMLIKDSIWVRQEDGNYTSDITKIIEQTGASVSQVYAMDLAGGNPVLEIFPQTNGDFMGGSLSGSVNLSKNEGTCTITFEFSKEEHEGEVHPAGSLPFNSVEIEVFLVKQNN
jgi:hypothetical protein